MSKLAAFALLVPLALAPAAAQQPRRPVVVELFTSQGCSSCPPADAFLDDLARSRADVLALGFHVTYWDGLGWRDPYSFDGATERQQRYANLFSLDSVYTPQMVVDGRHDVVGSNRLAAAAAIHAAADAVQAGPALRLLTRADRVSIDVGAGQGNATLWLIGYDPEHRTPVGRGENGGRTLLEANIVRGIVKSATWTGSPLHLQVTPPAGERLALVLQAADGSILGAARAEDAPAG